MKILSLSLLLVFILAYQNCADVQFDAINKSNKVRNLSDEEIDYFEEIIEEDIKDLNVFLFDSFERDSAFTSGEESFGWREFVEDNGKPIKEGTGNNVDAKIYKTKEMGTVADRDRALFFSGRAGSSFHKVFLITKAIDLSGYDFVVIKFQYLSLGLEKHYFGGKETLTLEVCKSNPKSCGASKGKYSSSELGSDEWAIKYDTSNKNPASYNTRLSGKDQTLSDWHEAEVIIDLSQISNPEEFIFRFNAQLDEGFKGNKKGNFDNNIEDGIAIDKVGAMAFSVND